MLKIILFSTLLFLTGCIAISKNVDGLSAATIASSDNSIKGVIGRYYARINYNDELTVDVMCFGLQERFVQDDKGWLTLVFRKDNKTKTLWGNYFFDSAKLKADIGELSLKSSAPLNPQGDVFNVTELLNSTTDGVLFVTYDFAANEYYKPSVKLRFDGLTFNKKFIPAVEMDINDQELAAKVSASLFISTIGKFKFELQ